MTTTRFTLPLALLALVALPHCDDNLSRSRSNGGAAGTDSSSGSSGSSSGFLGGGGTKASGGAAGKDSNQGGEGPSGFAGDTSSTEGGGDTSTEEGGGGTSAFGEGGAGGSKAGAAGKGTAGTAGKGTAGTGTAGTAGTGNPPDCSGLFKEGECGSCVESSCCVEGAACKGNSTCMACLSGEQTDGCESNTAYANLATCFENSCTAACTAASCNPVTNVPCIGAEAACDNSQTSASGYECYDDGNTRAQCQSCSDSVGYCKGGYGCLGLTDADEGVCAKYCCTDADCGTGKCDTSQGSNGAGLCVKALGASPLQAACDAPAVSPSKGSCISLD